MDDKSDLDKIGYKMGEVDFDDQINQIENIHVDTDPVPAPPALPPKRKVDVAVNVGKPSKEKIAKEKQKLSVIAIVCALVGLFVLAIIGGSVLAVSKLSETTGETDEETGQVDGGEVDTELPSKKGSEVEVTDEQRFIGDENLGYMKVDTYWRQINMADSAIKNRALYENGNYYITIVDDGVSTASPSVKVIEWRERVTNEGAENVEVASVEMGQLTAQQLKGYYREQNIWTMTWMFKTDDGHFRYVTVEGPSKTSRYFAIPNTYSLTK